jgi:endoglycosylceramidase
MHGGKRAWVCAALVAAACGGSDAVPDASPPDVGGLPVATPCGIDAPAPTALTVRGTRIVDGHGRTISLRGVNAGGRSKFAPYAPFDFPPGEASGYDAALAVYLDRAASWGIDVLRVPFSWQAAEPVRGAWDEAYLLRLDKLLDGAWQRGMWTILDFHQDVYAESFCGDCFPMWTLTDPPAPRHDCERWHEMYNDPAVAAAFDAFWSDSTGVRTAFRDMWRRMATRHRDRPGVIVYEPINEPHEGTAPSSSWASTTLPQFYTEMAALLVEVDPGALVFVDTTAIDGVASDTSLLRPVGDTIVLAPHSYDPLALFGGDVHPDVAIRLEPWAQRGAMWNVPTLIGEMGITEDHPEAAAHLRRHLDVMDRLELHGTWWEYSQTIDIWNHERLSVVRADGTETSMVDELARPYPRALAGTRIDSAYDPAVRSFTLRYSPTGDSPTEVAVPTRLGPVRIGARNACVDAAPGRVLVRADAGATKVELVVETE